MKLKTAILLLLVAFGGYYGFGTYTTHTSREVIAYKAFASALMEEDLVKARRWAFDEEAMRSFRTADRRRDYYRGDVRFRVHQILRHEPVATGDQVRLRVRQITRLDLEGERATLWGGHRRDEIHQVVLRRDADRNWKVVSFSDAFVGG